jgi:hypothetical protein
MSNFMDKVLTGLLGGVAGLVIENNRKDGGPVKSKTPYLVGEEGPEIIVPDSDGVVIPSSKDEDKYNVVIDKLFPADKKKKKSNNFLYNKLTLDF